MSLRRFPYRFAFRLVPIIASLCFAAGDTSVASAHDPDTSYARFTIDRERLELQFTYDLFTLARMAPRLDADGDRRVTDDELQAATPAIYDFLRRHIQFEFNDAASDLGEPQPTRLAPDAQGTVAEKDFHSPAALVPFTFVYRPDALPDVFWVQFNFFNDDELGERHTVLGLIEIVGHSVKEEVLFDRNFPDNYHEIRPSFAPSAEATPVPAIPPSVWRNLRISFFKGIEHIFTGPDHILFLLALIIVSGARDLVKIVTSFTIAHSVTLILAALGIVTFPSNYVEIAIATTVVYTAGENFWIKNQNRRWLLTFAFGLIHGLGFANVIDIADLPTGGKVRSLVAINVGIEVGQLAIVAALFPASYLLARWRHGKTAQRALSAGIALCGLGWLIDRALGLGGMPF